jgi:hypothetical protein
VRFVRLAIVCLVVLGALAQSAADAATPASGSITKSKRSLSWNGGPFTLSEPIPDSQCNLGGASDPICDHFMLSITLGDGAKIEVAIKTAAPNASGGIEPVQGDDYDLFVFAPNGALVAKSNTEVGNEKLQFKHRAAFNGKPYEIRVNPWGVRPGSTYKGTVKALTLK